MGTLTTTIKLNDQFSKALGAINTKINKTIQLAERMNRTTGSTKYADLLKLEVRLKEKEIALTKLQNENELKVARATEATAKANTKVDALKKQITLDSGKTARAEEKTKQAVEKTKQSENAILRVEEQRKLNAERIAGKLDLQNKALERQNLALQRQQMQYQGIWGQLRQWATKLRNILTMYYAIRGVVQGIGAAVKLSDKMTMNDAKLNLVAGGDKKLKNELEAKTFQAAQRSTTDYMEFTKAVGKLGILAGDKFANNDSIVRFVELMNKSFQISGAETSERNAAMLQITQAIASNRLQGDEFRSILENAPMVMEALSKSLGVGHDQLKKLAKEGQITADVLIKAMFDAGSKIEEMYKTLPMTWERHWQKLKNVGVLAFKPIHEQFKRLFNSKQFQSFINGICTAMIVLGNLGGKALKLIFDGLAQIPTLFQKFKDWVLQAKDSVLFLRNAVIALTTAWLIYKGVQIAIVAWTKLQLLWTTLVKAAQWAYAWVVVICTTVMNLFTGATTLATLGVSMFQLSLVLVIAVLALFVFWIFQTSNGWIDAISRMVGGAFWLWEAVKNVCKWIVNMVILVGQVIWNVILFVLNMMELGDQIIRNIIRGIVNVAWAAIQVIWNSLKWLFNFVKVLAQNIGIAFYNGWQAALEGFWTFIKSCLDGIKQLEPAINAVAKAFGAEGFSISTYVDDKIASHGKRKEYKSLPEFGKVNTELLKYEKLNAETYKYLDLNAQTFKYGSLDDAYNKGYNMSEKFLNKAVDKYEEMKDKLSDKLEDLKKTELGGQKVAADALNGLGDKLGDNLGDVGKNTGDTAKNTGDTAKNTANAYEEDYSYLRNWAYQSGMGNSIGYNIKIEQNNKNNIGSNMDLNRVIDAVRDAIIEGITVQAEGVRA